MFAKLTQRHIIVAAVTLILSQSLILAKAAFALVGLSDVQSGSLLLKANEPGKYVEAPIVASDYAVTVSGPTGRTVVTQQFFNPSEGYVEGVYVFPLPANSAVDTLKIVSGTRVIVGSVKEKQEAKQVYETAKAEGKAAALLEQERPNVFTNAVANIGPHEKVVVQIEYQETLSQSAGTFNLRLPLVVAPRYSPQPIIQNVEFKSQGLAEGANAPIPEPVYLDPKGDGATNPVSISVKLDAGFDVDEVKSATHQVVITELGAQKRIVSLTGAVPADRDFELTWAVKGAAPQAGLFKENIKGHDYLLGFVTPPIVLTSSTKVQRDITFVIDNSGSMAGTSMPQAKQSLIYGLSQLKQGDLFNVIRFDHTMTNFFGGSVEANDANLAKARAYVESLEAHGGTEMIPPMTAALVDGNPQDKSHLRQVVFITDGGISNEQQLFDTIVQGRGRSRVFMVGIGSAPNTYLMQRASELGRGTYTQIAEPSQLNQRMTDLFGKIGNPVITELKAELSGGGKITPENLPDLYRGEPVEFFADADSLSGTVKITGKIGGQDWQVSLPLDKAAPGTGVSKLWARRKIAAIEVAERLRQVTFDEANKSVLAVALEHQLVSSQTSLVAVDTAPKRPEGYHLTRADVPLNLPAGWDFDKVFGESTMQDAPKYVRKSELGFDKLAVKPVVASAAEVQQQVPLAAGATDSQMLALMAALLALFGLVLIRRDQVQV